MTEPFRIGISDDFKTDAPGRLEPVLADLLAPYPFIEYDYFPCPGEVVSPADIARFDGVITLKPRFTAASFADDGNGNERTAVIARWGVGYDMIDVPGITTANVLLAITVDAVRKPVAEAILTLLLALAKQLPAKDHLVRTGRWELKGQIPSLGLSGKTVGSVGMGNIGGEMFRLLKPFDLGRMLAHDPYLAPERAAELGVTLVDLPTVFRESDFVTVNCPLNDETHGLVNTDLLSLMKPTAYFINTARGPIVNQADLTQILQEGKIAGAGLDVFADEPIPVTHPLVQMDNVIVTPHALAWTDDLYQNNSIGAVENVLSILRGEVPTYTVNREVVSQPGFQARLQTMQNRWATLKK